jgi:hypothetical protein
MEDQHHGVFNSNTGILYKEILSIAKCDELNNRLNMEVNKANTSIVTNLVTGLRYHLDINIRDEYPEICDRLYTLLDSYLADLRMDPNARLYSQAFGGIKPHRDINHDGISNYTLLIYLNDDFDDGKLSIKTKRTEEERLAFEPTKFHKVFTFRPIAGYGVIFDKNLLHYAADVNMGKKNLLIIHLYSSSQ